jgi:hypothetical protein
MWIDGRSEVSLGREGEGMREGGCFCGLGASRLVSYPPPTQRDSELAPHRTIERSNNTIVWGKVLRKINCWKREFSLNSTR